MEEKKITDKSLLAMDACRPGHDDLQLPELLDFAQELQDHPELALRFARVQRCDAQIQAAMQDVDVPHGARERLLERLKAEVRSADNSALLPTAAQVLPEPMQARSLWWPLALAACLIIGASIVLVLSFNSSPSIDAHLTADVFYDQLTDVWKNSLKEKPPIPAPTYLAIQPIHWQLVRHAGLSGVAFDMTLRHCRGILFVAPMPEGLVLPTSPPPSAETFDEGRSIAVWQSGKQLCMLVVVEGNDRAYRDLIRASRGPIASVKVCRFRNFG